MTTISRFAILVPVLIIFFARSPMTGQERDYQSWYELGLGYGFANGLDLDGEIGQRFRDNFIQYDRTLITVTAGYDIFPWLKAGGGIRGLIRANNEFELKPGYRVHADVRFSRDWSQTGISLRNRLQYGFDDLMIIREIRENNLSDRTRLRVEQRFFGSRITWMGSAESWYSLTGRRDRKFYRLRYSTGIVYMIDFRSDLSLRYILDDEINVNNPLRAHILVVGFSYSL